VKGFNPTPSLQHELYCWLSIVGKVISRGVTGGGEEMCAEFLWELLRKWTFQRLSMRWGNLQ